MKCMKFEEPKQTILHNLTTKLQERAYLLVEEKIKSASACTETPVRLSKLQRISREQRKVNIGKQVYQVVDALRINKVVHAESLVKSLHEVRQTIAVVEKYLQVKQNLQFKSLRLKQLELCSKVIALALERSKYMERVTFYEASILSLLNKESILLDQLFQIDLEITKLCDGFGVSGQPFAEAGYLLNKVWGVVAKQLLVKIGKQ